MPMSEVVRVAQKNLAADQRLAEAEEKRREADEYLKESKTEQPDPLEPELPASEPDEDAEEIIAEKRKAALHALNYGEPEEQEQAFIEYEKAVRGDIAPRPTVVDTAKIKAEIKEELTGDQIRHKFNLPESQGGKSWGLA